MRHLRSRLVVKRALLRLQPPSSIILAHARRMRPSLLDGGWSGLQHRVAASVLCNRTAFIACLVFVASAMFALGMLATPSQAQERPTVTVARMVDGDTIEISPAIDGKEEVRLIGVDTPETVDPNTGVQPYGPQASQFTTQELEGERVQLEFDQERRLVRAAARLRTSI